MSTQNPYWPLTAWQGNFSAGVNDPDPRDWDDLTDRVVSGVPGGGFTVTSGKQFELNQVECGETNVLMRSADEALNPANPASPYNSGGNLLVPYRRLRTWAAWPLAGNALNATNDQWTGLAGSLADTAGFEAGTGTWAAAAGCSLASSTTRAHDGTHSMAIAWATTAGGAGVAELSTVSVPLRAGRDYTLSCWVWIGAGPAVTLACQGQTATSTTTTGAWQRVTLTWTATGASTDISIYTAGPTTTGQQVWVDSVQLESGTTASVWTPSGPAIYPVMSGYFERFPLTWVNGGFEGWAAITAVDALGPLSRVQLQDAATADCMQDGPAFLWPMWDASDARTLENVGALASRVGPMMLAPIGSPAAVTTAAGASGAPGVDSFSSLGLAPATAGDTYAPVASWNGLSGYAVGGTSGGYTFEVWFKVTATTRAMHLARVWSVAGREELALSLTAAGLVQLRHYDSTHSVDATVTSAGSYVDDGWHHAAVTATWAAGTVTETLQVDGLTVGATARAASGTMIGLGIMVGVDYWAGTGAFSGQLARVAVYPTALPAARVVSHWLAGRTGFAGDTTGQRIARILAWGGWLGATTLPDGATRHGPATGMAGQSVVAACQQAAATEMGSFVANPVGGLELIPRDAYYRQTTSGQTFGEDAGGGEAPYLAADAELDPTYVYDLVRVTRDGGTLQAASDVAAQARYGLRSVDVTTSHLTDQDAASMGVYLLGEYKAGHLRVPGVAINPAADPTLWPVALGTRYGDRVTWKRRTTIGLTVIVDGFVESVTHTVAPDSWVTEFRIQPAPTFQAGLIGVTGADTIGSTFITTY